MAFRPFASALLVLVPAACGGPGQGPADAPLALASLEQARGGAAETTPPPASTKGLAKQLARSIWGVVPEAPRRKKDLRPELVRGSAVAVAPDTLLASCRTIGRRERVGVVRHNKYRLARVIRPREGQHVCSLRVADAPLHVAGGFRSFADLREGEPVYAIVSRTSAEYALAEGQLVAKGGRGDQFLETTILLPPQALSAVLFDARGNLVGLGSGGPTEDSVVLGAPLSAALTPRLAQQDLGPPAVHLASLPPAPIRRPKWSLLIVRGERDRDDGGPDLGARVAAGPGVGPAVPGTGRPGAGSGGDEAGQDRAGSPGATAGGSGSDAAGAESSGGDAGGSGGGRGDGVGGDQVDGQRPGSGGPAPGGSSESGVGGQGGGYGSEPAVTTAEAATRAAAAEAKAGRAAAAAAATTARAAAAAEARAARAADGARSGDKGSDRERGRRGRD